MNQVLRVGVDYLESVHGPAAEEGWEPAVRIMELAKGRRIVPLPLSDEEIFKELSDVADLWDHPEVDHRPTRRTARRIRFALEDYALGIDR